MNERILEVSVRWESTGSVGFFCECSDTLCSEMLSLSVPDYEAIRALDDCFVVVRGHEANCGEHVVERRDGHAIVHPAPPGALAV